jgi:hypothetical protein
MSIAALYGGVKVYSEGSQGEVKKGADYLFSLKGNQER